MSQNAVLVEHELVNANVTLSESKEMRVDDERPELVVLVHKRAVGDRELTVKEIKVGDEVMETSVHTLMNERELADFEVDWTNLWEPAITEDQVAQEIVPALHTAKGLL